MSKNSAKLTFSKYDGDDFITVDNHKEATGVTLWRNEEPKQSWQKLAKAVKEKFGNEFHTYQEDENRILMLRNREVDPWSYLKQMEAGVDNSDDLPF